MESINFTWFGFGNKKIWWIKKISRKYFSKSVNNSIKRYGKNGLIYRTVYAEVPPRVEYTLTETGISLKPILEAMKTWGEAYQMKLSQ